MSFSGIVCLGYFQLAVMGALIAIAVTLATTPASEVETGFMDLILARPLVTALGDYSDHRTDDAGIGLSAGADGGRHVDRTADVRSEGRRVAFRDAGQLSGRQPGDAGAVLGRRGDGHRRGLEPAKFCRWRRGTAGAGELSSGLCRALVATGTVGRVAIAVPLLQSVRSDHGNPLPYKNLVVLGGIALAGFARGVCVVRAAGYLSLVALPIES